MRIVTKIEYIDVKEDYYEFYNMDFEKRPIYPISSDNADVEPQTFKTEIVHGKRFYINDKLIVIGWSKGVEDAIGIPLEIFENIEKRRKASWTDGYNTGKNTIWNFLKINGPDTDYWWLPIPILITIGVILA